MSRRFFRRFSPLLQHFKGIAGTESAEKEVGQESGQPVRREKTAGPMKTGEG